METAKAGACSHAPRQFLQSTSAKHESTVDAQPFEFNSDYKLGTAPTQ